jgi:glutamyl-tRNA reductase
MSSVKNLKKDINYVLSDVIEECYVWQLANTDKKMDKSEKIIDEAIAVFDALIEKVNTKKVTDKKKHFSAINKELEKKADSLLKKIEKL